MGAGVSDGGGRAYLASGFCVILCFGDGVRITRWGLNGWGIPDDFSVLLAMSKVL